MDGSSDKVRWTQTALLVQVQHAILTHPYLYIMLSSGLLWFETAYLLLIFPTVLPACLLPIYLVVSNYQTSIAGFLTERWTWIIILCSTIVLQAKQETEESIQSGNQKYNSMLAQRMHQEDELRQQIEDLKLAAAGKERELVMLAREKDASIASGRDAVLEAKKAWELERAVLQDNMTKVLF